METTPEIRKRRLREWIDTHFEKSQTRFAKATDVSVSQIGQWLNGHRNMTEDSAREVERKAKMPFGWLDGVVAGSPRAPAQVAMIVTNIMTLWDDRTIEHANRFQGLTEQQKRVVEAVANMPPTDS